MGGGGSVARVGNSEKTAYDGWGGGSAGRNGWPGHSRMESAKKGALQDEWSVDPKECPSDKLTVRRKNRSGLVDPFKDASTTEDNVSMESSNRKGRKDENLGRNKARGEDLVARRAVRDERDEKERKEKRGERKVGDERKDRNERKEEREDKDERKRKENLGRNKARGE